MRYCCYRILRGVKKRMHPRTRTDTAPNSILKVKFILTPQKLRRERTVIRPLPFFSTTSFETFLYTCAQLTVMHGYLTPRRYLQFANSTWIFEVSSSYVPNAHYSMRTYCQWKKGAQDTSFKTSTTLLPE